MNKTIKYLIIQILICNTTIANGAKLFHSSFIEINNECGKQINIFGNFHNFLFGDRVVNPDFYIKNDSLDSGQTKCYEIKIPDTTIGDLYNNSNVESLKLILRPNDTLKITILEWSNKNREIKSSPNIENVIKYLNKNRFFQIPVQQISNKTYLDELDKLKNYELGNIQGLPTWFYHFQKAKIYSFYERFKIRYLRKLLESEPNNKKHIDTIKNKEIILNELLKFDHSYHRYISNFIDLQILAIKGYAPKQTPYEKEIINIEYSCEILPEKIKEIYLLRKAISYDLNLKLFSTNLKSLVLDKMKKEVYINFFNEIEVRKKLVPGSKAPEFELIDNFGRKHKLEQYRGNVILLAFWFTSCATCISEFEHENKLDKVYEQKQFKVINICTKSSKESWISRIKDKNLEVLALYANQNQSIKLEKEFKIKTYPNYVLIDKDGNVIIDKSYSPSDSRILKIIEENIIK